MSNLSSFFKCLKSFTKTFKILTIIFSGILGLLGFIIVILCGVALCSTFVYTFINVLNHFLNAQQCFGLLVITGLFITLIGSFSVLSVIGGHYKRLLFAVFIYLFLTISISSMVLLTWSDMKLHFETRITTSIRKYSENKNDKIDNLQKVMGCCGSQNPKEYSVSNKLFSNEFAPGSCCNVTIKEGTDCSPDDPKVAVAKVYKEGCSTKMYNVIWPIILSIDLGLCALMTITIIIISLLLAATEGSRCCTMDENIDIEMDGEVVLDLEDEAEANNEENANENEDENAENEAVDDTEETNETTVEKD